MDNNNKNEITGKPEERIEPAEELIKEFNNLNYYEQQILIHMLKKADLNKTSFAKDLIMNVLKNLSLTYEDYSFLKESLKKLKKRDIIIKNKLNNDIITSFICSITFINHEKIEVEFPESLTPFLKDLKEEITNL